MDVSDNQYILQAYDRDSIEPLRYSITMGNTSIFSIDPSTGNLSLLVPLDYEMGQRSFYLEVTVTDVDLDGQNLTAMANITVQVIVSGTVEFCHKLALLVGKLVAQKTRTWSVNDDFNSTKLLA